MVLSPRFIIFIPYLLRILLRNEILQILLRSPVYSTKNITTIINLMFILLGRILILLLFVRLFLFTIVYGSVNNIWYYFVTFKLYVNGIMWHMYMMFHIAALRFIPVDTWSCRPFVSSLFSILLYECIMIHFPVNEYTDRFQVFVIISNPLMHVYPHVSLSTEFLWYTPRNGFLLTDMNTFNFTTLCQITL